MAHSITREEALYSLRDRSLFDLGRAAFQYKRELYGDQVTYTVNRHVNPTNLCIYSCKFCDFAAKPKHPHAYSLNESEIRDQLADPEVCEAHIVGGVWPEWGFERATRLVAAIREARPDLWIKAFTAVEIAYFAKQARLSTREVLLALKSAGVDALPGGGVEVLSERLHNELFPDKIGPKEWLRIHAESHDIGLPSNCTLLFGHIETDEELIDHLIQLRELQDRTGGFQAFIPLAYQPGKSQLVPIMATPERCLRVVAVSRLVLHNVPHIKAYWPTLQLETAAAALTFGADDLDGTLGLERIMQLAKTAAPSGMASQRMEALIRSAGQNPRRRDGKFASAPLHQAELV